jgi:hypothetical protein
MYTIEDIDQKYRNAIELYNNSWSFEQWFGEMYGQNDAKKFTAVMKRIAENTWAISEEDYNTFNSFLPKLKVFQEYEEEEVNSRLEKRKKDLRANLSQIDHKILDLVSDEDLELQFEEIIQNIKDKYTFEEKNRVKIEQISTIAGNMLTEFDPLWKAGSSFIFEEILLNSKNTSDSMFGKKVARLHALAPAYKNAKDLPFDFTIISNIYTLLKKFGKEKIQDQLETALLTAIEFKNSSALDVYPELTAAVKEWTTNPVWSTSDFLATMISAYKDNKDFLKLTHVNEPIIYRGMALDSTKWLTKEEQEKFDRDGKYTIKNVAYKHTLYPGTSWTTNIDIANRSFSRVNDTVSSKCIAKARTADNADSLFSIVKLQRRSKEAVHHYTEAEVFAIGAIVCDITFYKN